MISICREKLIQAGVPQTKAQVIEADIADFDLDRTFDLIIAPFRVLQNLETDQEVDGLFRCIRKHLSPTGTCILNVFRPFREPEEMQKLWATPEENLDWEVTVEGGRLACYARRASMDVEKLILYPELIYRRYEGETLMEESLLKIVMRCYYPDTFESLIVEHGYTIHDRWGGYEGEVYVQGPELVIQSVMTANTACPAENAGQATDLRESARSDGLRVFSTSQALSTPALAPVLR